MPGKGRESPVDEEVAMTGLKKTEVAKTKLCLEVKVKYEGKGEDFAIAPVVRSFVCSSACARTCTPSTSAVTASQHRELPSSILI